MCCVVYDRFSLTFSIVRHIVYSVLYSNITTYSLTHQSPLISTNVPTLRHINPPFPPSPFTPPYPCLHLCFHLTPHLIYLLPFIRSIPFNQTLLCLLNYPLLTSLATISILHLPQAFWRSRRT